MARIITHQGYLAGLDTVKEMSAFGIADIADVDAPDHSFSPGGEYLRDLRDALVEALDHADDPIDFLQRAYGDWVHGRPDEVVSAYTHPRWQTFTDLGAYTEDISDWLGEERKSMDDMCMIALGVIGERVLFRLGEVITDAVEEDDTDPFDDYTVESTTDSPPGSMWLTATCTRAECWSPANVAPDMEILRSITERHTAAHERGDA